MQCSPLLGSPICAAGTATIAELAARFAVHRATIANIAIGKSWSAAGGPIIERPTGPRSNTGFWGVTANSTVSRFWVYVKHEGRQISLGNTACAIGGATTRDLARTAEPGGRRRHCNFTLLSNTSVPFALTPRPTFVRSALLPRLVLRT